MSSLEVLTGSPYLSYSSFSTFLDCGERYRLTKVIGVKQDNAWYLLGGSAVHEATELLDTGKAETPLEAWQRAWEKQLASLEPGEQPRAGGRASKEYPNKENRDWWEKHGPQMVLDWQAHMYRMLAEGWVMLGVETPFELDLDGVLIRGFIDRVMVNPQGEAEAHDLKTGTRVPASTLQLGVYALGAEQALGVRPSVGRYYMTRTATFSPASSLLHYTPAVLTEWFGKTRFAIEHELFVPNVTAMCVSCGVREHCVAVGGTTPVFSPK